jgi:hypothetical protein
VAGAGGAGRLAQTVSIFQHYHYPLYSLTRKICDNMVLIYRNPIASRKLCYKKN